MPTKSKTPTFNMDAYSMTVHVQDACKFDFEKMFSLENEKTGVYFKAIMNSARKLIRGLGPVSVADNRTRLRVVFNEVAEGKNANPSKVFQELIQGNLKMRDITVSLQLLHAVLRIYGDVDNANGLGSIIPREIHKPFVCPHLTTTGWVILRSMNIGSRRNPSWILDVDPIHNFSYEYKSGSVVMSVAP